MAVVISLALVSQTRAAPPSWTSFQNGGRPTSTEVNLPTSWSPEKNIEWSVDIEGYGQSSPVIAHGMVVVTSTSGQQKDDYHVSGYDLDTGELQWQVSRKNPTPFKNTPMVSRAAPTAVATSEGFIAFFEGGTLLAIDESGKTIWERNLVETYGPIEARHGLSASLEQNASHVFVWVERSSDPYVLAIDKQSGKEIWKSVGVGSTSWSSPRLLDVGTDQHLICSASGKIVGLNPASGDRLWEFDEVSNNTACTPIPVENGVFLLGASDGRGETSPGAAAASNGLIEIKPRQDGSFNVGYRWQAKKATSTFGSPVVAGNTVAFVNRAGVLYRLDLENGEQQSTMRTSAGGIWATPLVSGDLLYLFGYKGTTAVVSLSDNKEIASNRCWAVGSDQPGFGGGNVLYAAAPTSNRLIVRRGDRLYAISEASP